MSKEVTLTAALRTNLLSLQGTQRLLDSTQLRLATGKKVNGALDNANAFFASQSLTNRANDLSRLLDGIGQGIQVLKAADEGIKSMTAFLEQMQAVAREALDQARASDDGEPVDRASLESSFNELRRLIGNISQKMLTTTLRGLERDGLVTRTIYPTIPPRVDYELTALGRELLVPIKALALWARENIERINAARVRFDRER